MLLPVPGMPKTRPKARAATTTRATTEPMMAALLGFQGWTLLELHRGERPGERFREERGSSDSARLLMAAWPGG